MVAPWSPTSSPADSMFAFRDSGIANKKSRRGRKPEDFGHVGLLTNEPPAAAGCSLSSHPTSANSIYLLIGRRQAHRAGRRGPAADGASCPPDRQSRSASPPGLNRAQNSTSCDRIQLSREATCSNRFMSVELQEVQEGKVLEVRVEGKLRKEDYQHFVRANDASLPFKVRILFEMHNFHG